MSTVTQLPGTRRLRIVKAALSPTKLGALSQLFPPAIPVCPHRRAEYALQAEIAVTQLELVTQLCRDAGLWGEAAAYRKLADDADVLAKRIEAPLLGVE